MTIQLNLSNGRGVLRPNPKFGEPDEPPLIGTLLFLRDENQMEADLNRQLRAPSFSASALMGDGVGPTLKACLKLTLQSLKTQMGW